MNDQEIEAVIGMVSEHNGKEMGLLGKAALRDGLGCMDVGAVTKRCIGLAKKHRWITAAHVLDSEESAKSKFGDADEAWNSVLSLASEAGGVAELLASDDVEWADRRAQRALTAIRREIRTSTADQARWAFRNAYNDLTDETKPAAELAAPETQAAIAGPETDDVPVHPDAKQNLAAIRNLLNRA